MSTLRHLSLLAAIGVVSGCASSPQPGDLSPMSARVTNAALEYDARTLDAWTRRLAMLTAARVDAAPRRAYALARAGAWLAFAREAYASSPRDGVADRALAQARDLVLALEEGRDPASLAAGGMPESAVRADLWAVLDSLRGTDAVERSPRALADAEVALVRAAVLTNAASAGQGSPRLVAEAVRTCGADQQVTRAEQIIASLQRYTVQLAGSPSGPAVQIDSNAPMRREVHFALNSATLSRTSRGVLQQVVEMLRAHPGVSLEIDGYTDPRGDDRRNRDLAMRRADAVRTYLLAASLPLGRVSVAAIGTHSETIGHTAAEEFARDRKVSLSFIGTDGRPLTIAKYVVITHDTDLQIERQKRRSARAATSARAVSRGANAPR